MGFGNIDYILSYPGILRSARTKDITMTRVGYVSELFVQRNAEMTKKLGKRVDQVNIIVDLEKLGMRHMWKPGMNMFSQISSLFEQNYPEMLKRIYIVNSPKIFPITYKIAKPFLSEETSKKIHVLGANFKDMLLKDIDADQLPKFLGGTCTDLDGDPYCPSKICAGGDVPIEYYIKMEADEMENCKVAVVGRGSTLQIDCNITTSNSVIRWQFTTEGYDIGFGVYKKATGIRLKSGLMEEVLVSQRVNSHFVPEDGSLCCRNPGIYVVRFDNTYSWTRSKTIHYIIDVLEPETVGYYATSDDCDDIYTSTQQNGASDAMNFFVPSEKIKLDEADSEGSHIEQGINIEQMHDSTANSADEGVQITRM